MLCWAIVTCIATDPESPTTLIGRTLSSDWRRYAPRLSPDELTQRTGINYNTRQLGRPKVFGEPHVACENADA
jgi:hypothetical protein